MDLNLGRNKFKLGQMAHRSGWVHAGQSGFVAGATEQCHWLRDWGEAPGRTVCFFLPSSAAYTSSLEGIGK